MSTDHATPDADGREPQWRITVEVPIRLSHGLRDALFTAVCDAVADWEPEQRDGWDADVSTCPARELDAITGHAQHLSELRRIANALDSEAAISARPGQLESLERLASDVRDVADRLRGEQ